MDNIFCDLSRLKYLGKGAIIGKTVRIRRPEETVIGDYTIIDDFTYISCPFETGAHCHIASNVTISGGQGKVTLGNFVGISAGSSVHPCSSDYISASLDLPSVPAAHQMGGTTGEIVMEDHVLLGAHSVVLPDAHLPEGFASAAHSVIRKFDYEAWTLYGGYNMKKLAPRRHDKLMKHLEGKDLPLEP